MAKKTYKEKDLFPSIKEHFISLGYKVNAEVNDCDVTAIKEDTLIVIELKLNFNVTLLYQALERKKVANMVYIAIKEPKVKTSIKLYQSQIAKSLGLGLIYVNLTRHSNNIDIRVDPEINTRRSSIRRKNLEKEIDGRSLQVNHGGTTNETIFTAYFESCIEVACALKFLGEASTKELKEKCDTSDKTYSILYKNFYGWFDKSEERGKYKLSHKGYQAFEDKKYEDFISHYEAKVMNKLFD